MDRQTIETYNKLAPEYDAETAGFWEEFSRAFLDGFMQAVGAGGRVLDVGSGPGRDALILKKEGLDVICLDASEAMVGAARAKGLESVLGDFDALPFPDGSFDGVWAYTSLLHVPKSEISKPLMEVARVLKADGVFGLGLIEGEGEGYRETAGVRMPRWFSFYTREEVSALLTRHGFRETFFEYFQPGRTKRYLHFIARKCAA